MVPNEGISCNYDGDNENIKMSASHLLMHFENFKCSESATNEIDEILLINGILLCKL